MVGEGLLKKILERAVCPPANVSDILAETADGQRICRRSVIFWTNTGIVLPLLVVCFIAWQSQFFSTMVGRRAQYFVEEYLMSVWRISSKSSFERSTVISIFKD